MMEGRRYSEGLHQALEAKEGVTDPEREPDAGLDHLPELFPPVPEARRHDRHGDDRGRRVRRDLQARGHRDPDQRAVIREDNDDEVYRTTREKYDAIVEQIAGVPRSGSSRCWSAPSRSRSRRRCRRCCKKHKIPHQVLNARYHEQEAYIIAQAGRPGRRDDRHQHGRPRHRHPARRQSRDAAQGRAGRRSRTRPSATRARPTIRAEVEAAREVVRQARRPVRHRHRAAREPPHRQPAARPLRPPGRSRRARSSSSRSKTI